MRSLGLLCQPTPDTELAVATLIDRLSKIPERCRSPFLELTALKPLNSTASCVLGDLLLSMADFYAGVALRIVVRVLQGYRGSRPLFLRDYELY